MGAATIMRAKGTFTAGNNVYTTATLFTAPANRTSRVYFSQTFVSVNWNNSSGASRTLTLALRAGSQDLVTLSLNEASGAAGDVVTSSGGGSTRVNFLDLGSFSTVQNTIVLHGNGATDVATFFPSSAFVSSTTLTVSNPGLEEGANPLVNSPTIIRLPLYLAASETIQLAAKASTTTSFSATLRYFVTGPVYLEDNV